MQQGLDLEPQNSSSYHNLGLAYMYAGRYVEAEKTIKRSIELNRGFRLPSTNLGLTYMALNRLEDARRAFQLGDSLQNDQGTSYLIHVLIRQGKKKEAQEAYKKLQAISRNQYVHEISFAIAAYSLGEKDLAHDYFKKAIENHDTWMLYYISYPVQILDGLLQDPRNKKLVENLIAEIGEIN
jgi:tetratricopeptide (TPR) repeat protein